MVLTSTDRISRKRVAFSVSVSEGKERQEAGKTQQTTDKKVTCLQKNIKKKSNYHLNKASVTKSLVRHADLPIPSTSTLLTKHHEHNTSIRAGETEAQVNQSENKLKRTSHDDFITKFSAPELYSSLMIAKKIERVSDQLKKPPTNLITKHPDVKREIEGKALNRLNYPFDEQVYRDLVALDICDEDLLGRDRCETREFSRVKDKEPNLSDFYEHRYGEEYGIVVKPKPYKIEKVRRYNALSVYHKTQQWKNVD